MADENVCLAFAELVGPLTVISMELEDDEELHVASYSSPVAAERTVVLFEPSKRHYSALEPGFGS